MDTLEEIRKRFNDTRLTLQRVIRFFYANLIEPKSEDDNSRRQEFVLNSILMMSIGLLVILTASAFFKFISRGNEYDGVMPEIPFIILLVFMFLHVLSRSLFFKLSSYLLVLIYFTATTLTAFFWGADVPQALIAYALIIVVSGILLGVRFSFFITFAIFCILSLLAYLQINKIIHVDVEWKKKSLELIDILEFSVTLSVISVVSWLSNREIKNSLERARKSESELKIERDMLEERVRTRTKELQRIQYEKARQLCRLAEFGRLSSGLFHDLSNYINALLLNIRKIDPNMNNAFSDAKNDLERVTVTMNKVGEFVCAINKQLSWQDSSEVFSVSGEIKTAIQVVSYRAIKNEIEIYTDMGDEDVYIYGNSIKFNQIIINMLINSIDAYGRILDKREKKIEVSVRKTGGSVHVFIEDWACGIPKNIENEIFNPFFTTKKSKGNMGIGLSNVKEMIEKSFGGSIVFNSQKGKGTRFVIELKDEHCSLSENK